MPMTIRGPGMGMLMGSATPSQLGHLDFLGIDYNRKPRITPHNEKQFSLVAQPSPVDNQNHRNEIEAKMLAGLRDRSPQATARIEQHLKGQASKIIDHEFDVITLDLLEGINISPAWILLIAEVLRDVEIELDNRQDGRLGRDIVINYFGPPNAKSLHLAVHIGDGALWTTTGLMPGGLYRPTGIPAMIRSIVPGRPLKDIVAHPLLDQYDLTIKHVDDRLIELEDVELKSAWAAPNNTSRIAAHG